MHRALDDLSAKHPTRSTIATLKDKASPFGFQNKTMRGSAQSGHVSSGSIVVDLISSIDKSAVTLNTRTSEISA